MPWLAGGGGLAARNLVGEQIELGLDRLGSRAT